MPTDWMPETVRALRDRLGLSQAQFAARLGCDVMTISRWERGIRQPTGLYRAALERLEHEEPDGEIHHPPHLRP